MLHVPTLFPAMRMILTTQKFNFSRNSQKHVADRKLLTIDAKDRVWSLAIGVCRGGAPKPNTFTWNWFRYKSAPAQILAVGLNDGRIKTFDLETGNTEI